MEYIDQTTKNLILQELKRIERDENVAIIYACESGSRAWGFASKDSDFDVRFIYVRPVGHYLSIEQNRSDTLEIPIKDDLDISGWDLKKALQLFKKSNPPLLEWLQSPIIYYEQKETTQLIRDQMPNYYSPIACYYHYLHMAARNKRQYLDGEEVWIKKYFYVLRPVLACIWIERGYGIVPTEFMTLVEKIVEDRTLRMAIDTLIQRKREGEELAYGGKIWKISNFLDREFERLQSSLSIPESKPKKNYLNGILRAAIIKNYGVSL